ncbi:MAG: sterol desaturase family protein, partial [Bacteroidota bacterium]
FDFFFYWAHRWSHEINFFWAAHVVHHSSEDYNLSVALRQSWWHNLIAFFIFMPLPVLGFDPLIFFLAAGLHTIYQFWIHTQAVGKLHPWIEYVMNTPSHHRVHHGRNPKYIDKNHGGVFIIWDRLFGTFQAEEEAPTYGITTPLNSLNPAWANLHYYAEMWGNMRKMRFWKDRWKMLWAKPGWLPEDMGGMQNPPPIDEAAKKKYDPKMRRHFTWYVAAQFGLIVLGLVGMMLYFEELSWFYRLTFFGILLLSTMICGALLENKRWVVRVEYVRLILVVLSVNSLYYFQYMDWFVTMLIASGAGFLVFNLWFTLSWRWAKRIETTYPHFKH